MGDEGARVISEDDGDPGLPTAFRFPPHPLTGKRVWVRWLDDVEGEEEYEVVEVLGTLLRLREVDPEDGTRLNTWTWAPVSSILYMREVAE